MFSESGQDIRLSGETGEEYEGKIYSDKNGTSSLSGKAIACLSNSTLENGNWHHSMNSIYNTENITEVLEHFRNRDDISHLILLPYEAIPNPNKDHVDNLIRYHLHR